MFLILHHRQVFHKSLIFYEIHYENMRNVHFLKKGIRRKSIISVDYIILKHCFPSVLSVCQYRIAALHFFSFIHFLINNITLSPRKCLTLVPAGRYPGVVPRGVWTERGRSGFPECPCPAPALGMLPGKGLPAPGSFHSFPGRGGREKAEGRSCGMRWNETWDLEHHHRQGGNARKVVLYM